MLRVNSTSCQLDRQKTMPDMASGFHSIDKLMQCLALFSDAISGVKNSTTFMPAINYTVSASLRLHGRQLYKNHREITLA